DALGAAAELQALAARPQLRHLGGHGGGRWRRPAPLAGSRARGAGPTRPAGRGPVAGRGGRPPAPGRGVRRQATGLRRAGSGARRPLRRRGRVARRPSRPTPPATAPALAPTGSTGGGRAGRSARLRARRIPFVPDGTAPAFAAGGPLRPS